MEQVTKREKKDKKTRKREVVRTRGGGRGNEDSEHCSGKLKVAK